jgi:MYXO-CTERM domain-containing protein
MRLLKLPFIAAVLCAAQAAAGEESFQGALQRGAAAHPSQYSFAELYRATVSAPVAAALLAVPALDTPVRVAAGQAPAQFSVAETPTPRPWLLLLAGLAAAVWVARRKLGYGF